MLGEVWSAARGWLTPPVLFLLINVVVGTIVVASRLMSAEPEAGGGERRRGLTRAPSAAFDRLRCFSFSRIGHAPGPDDDGERLRGLLRAPSAAFDRLRCFSFSRPGLTAEHAPALPQPPPFDDGAAADKVAPSPQPPPPLAAEPEVEREHAPRVERSRSEAAAEAPARRRPRARRARKAATEEDEDVPAALPHLAPVAGTVNAQEPEGARRPATGPRYARRELAAAVEVDEQADDFIRRFREQLRLQRLDSILRHRDTLRRTGTV